MSMAMFRIRRVVIAKGVFTVGVLLLAGCSAPKPESQPSVAFGSGGGSTPGMPGMTAMPPTGPAPSGTASAPVAGEQAGGTVTWTNHDEEPHTVAANDGTFHSPGMGTGATFSHTFPAAGTFDYVCSIHPMMHGTVVVTG